MIHEEFNKIAERIFEIIKKIRAPKKLTKAELEFVARVEQLSESGRVSTNAMPVYESQKICTAASGFPIGLQKEMRKMGCDAFRDHRVHFGPLVKYLFEHFQFVPKKEGDAFTKEMAARTKLDHYRALREQQKYEADAGKLIPKQEVREGLQRAVLEYRGSFDKLCSTLPPVISRLAGEMEIKEELRRAGDEMWSELREKFDDLAKEEKAEA